jgi:hypothetical protein
MLRFPESRPEPGNAGEVNGNHRQIDPAHG